MVTSDRKRTCFIIMPFGEKKDIDGQDIDFDDIYRFFFKKAIEDLGIECIRCDEIEESGSIHEKMFEHIYQADVVVVDITTSNANVYYELGIRHTLAKGVTVLIRRKGTTIPFNIQGLQVVEYDQGKFASIERAKARIHQIIKNGLDQRLNDSPVHSVLDLNIEPDGKPLDETKLYEYRLKSTDDLVVGLITGDIQNVTSGVDVWVNPENTNMRMSRPFDNTISGIIRYYGATKVDGQVEDTIAQALAEKMNGRESVNPAEVLVTTSGALDRTHKVQRIFHVAANVGQVGQGYTPVADVPRCVVNALSAVTDNPDDCLDCDLRSILIPLMGTKRRPGMEQELRVKALLNAAVDYLAREPKSTFRKVYFLAYSDKELEICQDVLRADARLTPTSANALVLGEAIAGIGTAQTSALSATTGSSGNGATATAKRTASARAPHKHPKSS